MQAQAEIVYGIAIVSFLFIYVASKIDMKEYKHLFFLKLAFLSFGLILLLGIPKIYIQFNQSCYPVVNQTNDTGTVTSYTYGEFCVTKDNNTPITLNKTIMWALRFYFAYVFLAMVYELFIKAYLETKKMRFGGKEK